MDRFTALARLLVVAAWLVACAEPPPVRPLESQLQILCDNVAGEVALRTGGEPSPVIQFACVESLRRVFGTQPPAEPELQPAPYPDAGR